MRRSRCDPADGHITLDGIDLNEPDPVTVHARIGVIFQDFVHYHFTARENIGFGQSEALHDTASCLYHLSVATSRVGNSSRLMAS